MIKNYLFKTAIEIAERGWVPDRWVRTGIRRLLRQRLRGLQRAERFANGVGPAAPHSNELATDAFLQQAFESELAIQTDKANQQHYEVPTSFFRKVLGPRLKYSCCYFEAGDDLATAESRALAMTCQHADLADGMEILELGCGWGSLTLWMLERYPAARVTAVSNSHSQREYIERLARRAGWSNRLQVVTTDICEFDAPKRFQRIVSVEMLEHVRNHASLIGRMADWLTADGKCLLHIFCHDRYAYPFVSRGPADWMAEHFFSGGMMPSRDLFRRTAGSLQQTNEWIWNGRHYQQTCQAWIARMDENRSSLLSQLGRIYGASDCRRWFNRWRMFFMACAELFGYRNGDEWYVGHFLLEQSPRTKQSQRWRSDTGNKCLA